MKTEFYLDGSLINPPKNWKEMQLELNFDRDAQVGVGVNIPKWEFVRENAELLSNIIKQPTLGGNGIFEGIPFQIQVDRDGVVETPFDGYLDLTDDATFSCEESVINAKERKSIDWLNDIADGVTFESLVAIGVLTKEDVKFIPYVINSIPDYQGAGVALLSIFVISDQIVQAINRISKLTFKAANPFEAATAIAEAILEILYLATLLAALVKLVIDLVNSLIQKVKYHGCMNVKRMLEAGASQLGLTFDSDIINSEALKGLTIMPEKWNNPIDKEEKTFGFIIPNKQIQTGHYRGTFGDLLRELKITFNARIYLQDNVIKLLRVDQRTGSNLYQVPDVKNDLVKTNAGELISNYAITFNVDTLDKNTVQRYQGTSYQVITKPKTYNNLDLRLMKGFKDNRIGFALAKRKEELTRVEELFKTLLDAFGALMNGLINVVNALIKAINAVIKVLNKIIKALGVVGIKVNWQIKPVPQLVKVDLGNLIENRIGMLELENDWTNVPRLFLLEEGISEKYNKISTTNETIINAKWLWENLHFSNSFVPSLSKPNGNQYLIKDYENVPFCFGDYQQIKGNPFALMPDGSAAEFVNLIWNPYERTANFTLKISYLYTNNLIETYLYPDGI